MGALDEDDDDFDLLFLDSFEEGAFAPPLGPPASSETSEFDNGMKQLRMDEKIAICLNDTLSINLDAKQHLKTSSDISMVLCTFI
ncbi:hypothetical protein L3X38_009520 [Prunus dulcis]|uniref:Uncharacterized protein n=1 Tax=Prunus dulcis TaxID=3755 RepID=A0AAD4WDP8_PRUDU|nr:hypothetical protein L3X38_009520 [Prunus dulcis]